MKTSTILLADSRSGELTGNIYRKQIARFGKWVNPIYPWGSEDRDMILDMAWAKEMIANFNKKDAIQHVPVPLNHTDDVSANTGEVVKLEAIEGDGLYAYIDVRKQSAIEEIEAGTIFDVSMSFDWDFVDTETGKHHGIVLLHVALVNNPYLTKMSTFERVEEALRELSHRIVKPIGLASTSNTGAIMLSESKAKELQHMLVTIKNTRDFDITLKYKEGEEEKEVVIKAGEEAQVPKDVSEQLLNDIAEAEKPSGDAETPEQKAEREAKEAEEAKKAEEDEANKKKQQESDEDEKAELSRLRKLEAETIVEKQYNTLLSARKITPAQKEAFMNLSKVETKGIQLSGKQTSVLEIVSAILEAGSAKFSTEENGSQKTTEGKDNKDDEAKTPSEQLSAEEREGLKASGIDIKRMDELAEKYPAMAEQLKKNREEK